MWSCESFVGAKIHEILVFWKGLASMCGFPEPVLSCDNTVRRTRKAARSSPQKSKCSDWPVRLPNDSSSSSASAE